VWSWDVDKGTDVEDVVLIAWILLLEVSFISFGGFKGGLIIEIITIKVNKVIECGGVVLVVVVWW